MRPVGVRHSEALLLSGNIAGGEPASVICTLAAKCRSFSGRSFTVRAECLFVLCGVEGMCCETAPLD